MPLISRPTAKCGKGVIVGVGLASAASGLQFARQRARQGERAVGGRNRWGRNLRLARLGARGAGRFAAHRARRTFASADRRMVLDEEFQLRSAADVAAELGQMKGALMKIGQMASYVDTGLPEPVRQTLASLQSQAPPMSAELSAGCIRAELGVEPEEAFQTWDPLPVAAASIGQVHRAITWDDRAVAVKVQYPGVADAVEADLGNAGLILGAMGTFFPGLETGPVVEEIRERIVEELDYSQEAENQRSFARLFDNHPFMVVPGVVEEFSTSRVLTSDLATGASFAEVKTWSQDEKNLVAEAIFRFSFGSIYRLHSFNGDPHPGNYLFEPGGRVTFLDFGLIKRFSQEETRLFERMITAMVLERDAAKFRRVVEDAGLLPVGAPFSDAEVEHYFEFYYSYLLDDVPVTLDHDFAARGVAHLFGASASDGVASSEVSSPPVDRNSELIKILNVPPSFVILQRITLGLMGLLADLEATQNWRRIAEELWPFVAASPSTPMGEEIAAWRSSRGQAHFGI